MDVLLLDYNRNNKDNNGGGGEMTLSKKECTSCEQNNVDIITEDFNSVAIQDDTYTCASCAKEGNSDDMNTCNKCKMVKYCNAACKKKHRKKHKKACEKRVAELHEERLFKDVEPEECPICMLTLPINANESSFFSCCGKMLCNGCIYAMNMSEGKDLCPFCRTPLPSNEEYIKRLKALMDNGNADAYYCLGNEHAQGMNNISQDWNKACKLYLKAGELGCSTGYYNLGSLYYHGGVW